MTRLDALRSTVAELERMHRALGGYDVLASGREWADRLGTDGSPGRGIASRSGNPYHDPATGEFTSGPGSAAHRSKRRRRRLKRAMRALKARHKAERVALADRQRARHASHRLHYERAEAGMKRRHGRELAKLDRQHGREIAVKERRRERERAKEGNASSEQVAKWEADHAADIRTDRELQAKDRESLKLNHEGERTGLREERRGEADRIRTRDAAERRKTRERHRDERAELIEQHGFRRKGTGDGDATRHLAVVEHSGSGTDVRSSVPNRMDRKVRDSRRLSPGRTHKASSAESILRHVLRLLGWTAAYKRGKLTERRRIRLLDAIRQYGREWLRHDAEQLFRAHGAQRSLATAARHAVGRFFDRARGFVRELIVAGAMALSGPEPLDEHDLQEADRAAHTQTMYLDRFRADVELRTPPEIAHPMAPPDPDAMTALQFVARAEEYAGSTWGAAINARRERIKSSRKYTHERRVHARPMGEHDACATCKAQSDRGWVPIGSLAPIGDSECLGIHCDCYFEYRGAA